MNVFLRRNKMLLPEKSNEVRIGKLIFLPEEMKLVNGNENISLTQRESELLRFFCAHPNKALKREDILTHVWGKNDYFLGRSMDVFVTKLRKHLKSEPTVNIETVHNVGFRFNLQE
jgi:DNA-binding response OmpR family regulator